MIPRAVVLFVLAWPGAAVAYTPSELPVPPHCAAHCRGTGDPCGRNCAAQWAQLPWRQKLKLLLPKTGQRCLQAERRCCGSAQRCKRCRPALQRCVWRALGVRARPMRRCWSRWAPAHGRCAKLEGRAGWSCRHEVDVRLHDCRRKAMAGHPRHDDDDYRLKAMVEQELGKEGR